MAAPICIKLSGFIKYMVESVLAKEFFEELKKEKTLISKIARGHWVQSIQPGWMRLIRGGLFVEGNQDIKENVLANEFV